MNIKDFVLYRFKFNEAKQKSVESLFNKLLINNQIKITIGTVRGDGNCYLYSIAEQIKKYNMDRLYDSYTITDISDMFKPLIIDWSLNKLGLNPFEGIDGQCPNLDILSHAYTDITHNNVVIISMYDNDDKIICYASNHNNDTYFIFSCEGHCYPVFVQYEFSRREIFNALEQK
jgi:hypothetical protein